MMLRTTIRNLLIESRYVSPLDYPHRACKITNLGDTAVVHAYFLFREDITDFIEYAKELLSNPDVHPSGAKRILYRELRKDIIGYAEVQEPEIPGSCNNAVEIKMIAAESPYGPTLYDIILADNFGVLSDSGGTQPRAISVYEKYLTSRPDVEVRYLDSTTNSSTKKFKGDDCFGRNYYALWDIEDHYINGESDVEDYDKAVRYEEYPEIVDLPLDQEQLYSLSFHMHNANIEYEVSDLLSDSFYENLIGVLGADVVRAWLPSIGSSYFDRKYEG